jgi:hypothetical protein
LKSPLENEQDNINDIMITLKKCMIKVIYWKMVLITIKKLNYLVV